MENLVKIAEGVLTSCLAVKPGEQIPVITDADQASFPL